MGTNSLFLTLPHQKTWSPAEEEVIFEGKEPNNRTRTHRSHKIWTENKRSPPPQRQRSKEERAKKVEKVYLGCSKSTLVRDGPGHQYSAVTHWPSTWLVSPKQWRLTYNDLKKIRNATLRGRRLILSTNVVAYAGLTRRRKWWSQCSSCGWREGWHLENSQDSEKAF